MRELRTQRREVDQKALRYRTAQPSDWDTLIEESTRIYDGDELKIVYEVLPAIPEDLLTAFKSINSYYLKGARAEGLQVHSRVIGFQPRLALRRDYCTRASMSWDYPKSHDTFMRYALKASEIYREQVPLAYAAQASMLFEKVKPEWRIPGTVFTSGIANWDAPLHYHTDTGNFPGTWNAMYALTFDCDGGQLSLPEYGLGFSFKRPAYIIFPAQDVLHGVTPLQKRSRLAYRYSVVYYALALMCHCLSAQEEVVRIQKIRTVREHKRAGLIERSPEELKAFVTKGAKEKAAKNASAAHRKKT